jgi:hypothetical protein
MPAVVVDIGCGLGDVISRVPADMRFGCDPDQGAISAGRLLFGRSVFFVQASISDTQLITEAIGIRSIDLLIMTNWLHGWTAKDLLSALERLREHVAIKMILIDSVRPGRILGAHSHTSATFAMIGRTIRTVDAGDGVRDLHLIDLYSDDSLKRSICDLDRDEMA